MRDKEIIKRNFSRCAKHYDRYCSIQNHSARKLIDKLKKISFLKILDIGSGTGNYTRLLRKRFPNAKIKALDISSEMVRIAKSKLAGKRVDFIVADAETLELDDKFDLISSNACFQWFEHLEEALVKYRDLLLKNGTILFSIFGPLTFFELNGALRELFKKDITISSSNFIKKDRLEKILKKHFKEVYIQEQVLREGFNSLWELLNRIKYTGAKGDGINNRGFGRLKILDLEKIYKKEFKGIPATYQIFYCRAER